MAARWRVRADVGLLPIARVGEDCEPGAPSEVRSTAAREGAVVVSSDAAGAAVLGTIAGGDRYRLIRSGDVLLTEIIDSSFVRATPGAQVVDSTVGPDVVTALVDADGEALVTVAINHHPGWSAQVDGEEVGIVRADSAFMGVDVGPGRHSLARTLLHL